MSGQTLSETQSELKLNSPALAKSIRAIDPSAIPYNLICSLVAKKIAPGGGGGDVLIFLPGLREISLLTASLVRLPFSSKLHILPLHSSLPTSQQHQIYEPSPNHLTTKIILATSIAEASITVPSITLVIDSAKSRTQILTSSGLSALVTSPSSRSSLDQRAGRAGRVQAGTCFHLFPKTILEKVPPHPIPEILTTPLPTLSLRARILLRGVSGSTKSMLTGVLTMPPESACARCDAELVKCHAIDEAGNLLPHGEVLAHLPLSLNHARALVAGYRLGVGELMAFLVAGLTAEKTIFSLDAKLKWGGESASDHVAILKLARTDHACKREAASLMSALRRLLGEANLYPNPNPNSIPLIFVALILTTNQIGNWNTNGVIVWENDINNEIDASKSRSHQLKPHSASSVLSRGKKRGAVLFGDVIKLPGGVVVKDGSNIPPIAVELWSGEGEMKELRERLVDVVMGRAGGGEEVEKVSERSERALMKTRAMNSVKWLLTRFIRFAPVSLKMLLASLGVGL